MLSTKQSVFAPNWPAEGGHSGVQPSTSGHSLWPLNGAVLHKAKDDNKLPYHRYVFPKSDTMDDGNLGWCDSSPVNFRAQVCSGIPSKRHHRRVAAVSCSSGDVVGIEQPRIVSVNRRRVLVWLPFPCYHLPSVPSRPRICNRMQQIRNSRASVRLVSSKRLRGQSRLRHFPKREVAEANTKCG
jgi:hypothetical protein